MDIRLCGLLEVNISFSAVSVVQTVLSNSYAMHSEDFCDDENVDAVWLADLNPGSQSNLAQVPLNRLLVANAQAWRQMSSTARSPENRLSYSLDKSMTW